VVEITEETDPMMEVIDKRESLQSYRIDKTTKIPILDRYLRFVGREGSNSTLDTYRITLREFLLHIGNGFTRETIEEITQDDVEDYFTWLDSDRKIRKNTQKNKYLYLHAFFNWCKDREYIQINPIHKAKKFVLPSKRAIEKEKPRRPFFSENEVKRVLRSIKESDSAGDPTIRARDHAMLSFGFYCASRVGEIRALRIGCIFRNPTSQNWWVNFRGKGGHRREHPLPIKLLETLKKYLTLRDLELDPAQCMMNCKSCAYQYLFVTRTRNPFTTNQDVTRRLKKYVKSAGLNPTRYASHSMRRSAITLMLKKGMPLNIIQKFSGHKDITILQRYLRDMPSTVEEELPRINW
jgi:integrase